MEEEESEGGGRRERIMAVGVELPTVWQKGGREGRMNSTQTILNREEEDGEKKRRTKRGVREQNIRRRGRQTSFDGSLAVSSSSSRIFVAISFSISKNYISPPYSPPLFSR